MYGGCILCYNRIDKESRAYFWSKNKLKSNHYYITGKDFCFVQAKQETHVYVRKNETFMVEN